MRKLTYLLALIAISCSSDDPEPNVNPLVGTVWKAGDYVADFLYGGENAQFYEFLDDANAQHYYDRDGSIKSVVACTYTVFHSDSVVINQEEDQHTFTLQGSLLISHDQTGDTQGSPLTYSKQ